MSIESYVIFKADMCLLILHLTFIPANFQVEFSYTSMESGYIDMISSGQNKANNGRAVEQFFKQFCN